MAGSAAPQQHRVHLLCAQAQLRPSQLRVRPEHQVPSPR